MVTEELKVGNRNFESLFKTSIQFEIPFFQRGYCWERKHWEQLFVDINEQILPELDTSENLEDVEHFFGPIVVLQKRTGNPELQQYLVIDGQQRITTIYLLLAKIRHLIEEKSHESPSASEYFQFLSKYLINDIDNHDDYLKLKVFSCKGDRLPAFKTVFNRNPNSPSLQVDMLLYSPGTNKIDIFNKYLDKKLRKDFHSVPKLWQLSRILLKSLKIVWIPLDESKDDPQAIFESLNDRGMPLSASELLCNYLFRPIITANEEYESLHNDCWLKAIRDTDSSGSFEDYLRIFFSIGENKIIGQGRRIYVHFKYKNKNLNKETAKSVLLDLKSNINIYNAIVDPVKNRLSGKDISNTLIKIGSTRMDACNVFLLALLKSYANAQIDETETAKILNEICVLLVRRKMCELATQKYDTIFPNLFARIVREPNKPKAISNIISDEGYFVSDQDFLDALINRQLYRTRDLPFSRMVLQEVDKKLQVYNQLPDYSTLSTIEHVIPQTIDETWKTYLGEDAKNPDLQKYINTIGNLCLLSGPANSHAGQDPFESKIKDYTDVCALAKDLKKRKSPWNIKAIVARSEELGKIALQIWPWSL